MPSVRLRDVSFSYTTAAALLERAHLDLSSSGAAWVGVVGANGAGKSTLLRLVAGQLAPTAGRVDRDAGVTVLVPQTVDVVCDDVVRFARAWDDPAPRLRSRLHLDPDDVPGRWDALSPGRRRRWQVGAALALEPDLLLLDEPTNHLDADTRELVLGLLSGFAGLGLVVSHDRAVLDRLTGRTLRLHRRRLELHAGAYSDASARWRAEEHGEREAHDRARRELRRQRRILADVRRDRHSAEAGPRRQRREAGPGDPDAREAGRRLAQAKAEAALARRVGQLRTRVARTEEVVDAFDLARDRGGAVAFPDAAPGGRRVLARIAGEIRHPGGGVVLRDVDLALGRNERVRVAGANGAGKTSLLHAALETLDMAGKHVAVLPQELDAPAAEVAGVRGLDAASRGRVLGVAALLGVDPDRVLATDDPSPGEARKLVLARLLAGPADVLVLDEPTNHLDLPSIERLEEALRDRAGALLLVTHDDRLADAATDLVWRVADGRVERVG